MNAFRILWAIPVFAIFFLLLASAFPDAVEYAEQTRTDPASEEGLTCTTGVGETSCSVELAQDHAFVGLTGATVTRTDPGPADWTANSTLGSDRRTVTMTSLTAATTYLWDVDYSVVDADLPVVLPEILHQIPALFLFGGMGVLIAGMIAGAAALLR